ncbi:hypothetical protein AYO45_04715 [Gammaproteobacteria bacterium SCGC AG-212-F23]|nr:hypothetical protein AYO45_04715 [Gammaproteobacteria bacterium SCGC AG-212-F23]
MKKAVKDLIEKLHLEAHIEGGYYKRTYRSSIKVQTDDKTRLINSAIYYLLESHDFSCWHRLKSDEIWHHYCGNHLIIYQIDAKGNFSSILLGNPLEHPNAVPQHNIPAGVWLAAKVVEPDSFSLVGCTVAPGFEFEDLEIGSQHNLLSQYPQHREIILELMHESVKDTATLISL